MDPPPPCIVAITAMRPIAATPATAAVVIMVSLRGTAPRFGGVVAAVPSPTETSSRSEVCLRFAPRPLTSFWARGGMVEWSATDKATAFVPQKKGARERGDTEEDQARGVKRRGKCFWFV